MKIRLELLDLGLRILTAWRLSKGAGVVGGADHRGLRPGSG